MIHDRKIARAGSNFGKHRLVYDDLVIVECNYYHIMITDEQTPLLEMFTDEGVYIGEIDLTGVDFDSDDFLTVNSYARWGLVKEDDLWGDAPPP